MQGAEVCDDLYTLRCNTILAEAFALLHYSSD